MPTFADLGGFDLVFALPEHTINSQFGLLSALSVLPTRWSASTPDELASITAELGTPSVSFAAGSSTGSALSMNVPLTSGTFNYVNVSMQDGKPVATPEQTDVSGATLVFTSGLKLAEIAAADSASIPSAVQAQLQRFDPSMLSIQQLFLDLEDIDLSTVTLVVTNLPVSVTTQQQIASLVKTFVASLGTSSNPYVLGYTAVNRTPDQTAPTWIPTGMTFSLFTDGVTPALSSVNHLLVTDGRAVPSSGGTFTSNWVTSTEAAGTFVVAAELVMTSLLTSLCGAIGQDPSIFSVVNGTQVVGSFSNQIGGTTTCTIVPEAGQPSVQIQWHSTYRKTVHDEAGSDIGYVDGYIDQVTTIEFTVDSATGKVQTSVTNSTPTGVQNRHPNTLGNFERALAVFGDAFLKLFSGGFAPNVFEKLVSDDWKTNVTDVTVGQAASLTDRVVLPAGGQLLFSALRFGADGTLLFDATIAN